MSPGGLMKSRVWVVAIGESVTYSTNTLNIIFSVGASFRVLPQVLGGILSSY